jgi:hypothetical protein
MAMESTLPEVFAQRTYHNERIVSLLSSVLMRRLRPEFYDAIRDRFPSTIETRSIGEVHRMERTVSVGIIFVKEKENHEMMELIERAIEATDIFSKELVLDGSSLSDCVAVDRILQLLNDEVHAVLVATPATCDWLLSYLLSKQARDSLPMGLRGVIPMFPTGHESLSLLDIPSLCIVDKKQPDICRGSALNPRQITAMVPFSGSMGTDKHERLWIARAVLKYLNAVIVAGACTQGGQTTEPTSLPQSRL